MSAIAFRDDRRFAGVASRPGTMSAKSLHVQRRHITVEWVIRNTDDIDLISRHLPRGEDGIEPVGEHGLVEAIVDVNHDLRTDQSRSDSVVNTKTGRVPEGSKTLVPCNTVLSWLEQGVDSSKWPKHAGTNFIAQTNDCGVYAALVESYKRVTDIVAKCGGQSG